MTYDPEDRFGMPESALRAAAESHGADNPMTRLGMYVPTRGEGRYARSRCSAIYSGLLVWRIPNRVDPH